jgi:hypothetical protein
LTGIIVSRQLSEFIIALPDFGLRIGKPDFQLIDFLLFPVQILTCSDTLLM